MYVLVCTYKYVCTYCKFVFMSWHVCMYIIHLCQQDLKVCMYVCMYGKTGSIIFICNMCMYVWIMTVSFILSLFVGVQLRHELQWRLRHSRRQWRLQHEHQRHHHLHQTAQKCVSQPMGVYPNLLDPSSCGIPHRLPYFLMQVTFAHTFVHTYTYTLILPYLHVHT